VDGPCGRRPGGPFRPFRLQNSSAAFPPSTLPLYFAMRHTAPHNRISHILAQFDEDLRQDWHSYCVNWAYQMLDLAEKARHKDYHRAWEVALRACRSALVEEPLSPNPLPGWFGPRMRHAIGYDMVSIRRFEWADHTAVVKVDGVKCFISEPYPWWPASWMKSPQPLAYEDSAAARWEHVIGDFAHLVPADDITESAAHLASVTGCKLSLDRIAWHYPMCFRMTFVPLNPRIGIKAAIELYNP
jgi:hypothetical protein